MSDISCHTGFLWFSMLETQSHLLMSPHDTIGCDLHLLGAKFSAWTNVCSKHRLKTCITTYIHHPSIFCITIVALTIDMILDVECPDPRSIDLQISKRVCIETSNVFLCIYIYMYMTCVYIQIHVSSCIFYLQHRCFQNLQTSSFYCSLLSLRRLPFFTVPWCFVLCPRASRRHGSSTLCPAAKWRASACGKLVVVFGARCQKYTHGFASLTWTIEKWKVLFHEPNLLTQYLSQCTSLALQIRLVDQFFQTTKAGDVRFGGRHSATPLTCFTSNVKACWHEPKHRSQVFQWSGLWCRWLKYWDNHVKDDEFIHIYHFTNKSDLHICNLPSYSAPTLPTIHPHIFPHLLLMPHGIAFCHIHWV